MHRASPLRRVASPRSQTGLPADRRAATSRRRPAACSMLRLPGLLAALLATASVPGAAQADDASRSTCRVDATAYDAREITCPLAPSGTARRVVFTARFSGGHDDTMARIETFLNGEPLRCGEGSRTSLFAEDGDVSLHCRFSVAAAAAGNAGMFRSIVRWSHAEYVGFDFADEP